MRVTGFVVLACLAAAGCAPAAEDVARAAVAKELRDPSGAEFYDVEKGTGGAVCGSVNAPNAFGGMTGRQRFIVLADGSVVLEERHSPAFLDEIDALAGCKR